MLLEFESEFIETESEFIESESEQSSFLLIKSIDLILKFLSSLTFKLINNKLQTTIHKLNNRFNFSESINVLKITILLFQNLNTITKMINAKIKRVLLQTICFYHNSNFSTIITTFYTKIIRIRSITIFIVSYKYNVSKTN